MNMIATVLRVNRQSLLVRNEATGEEVVVFFSNPGAFAVGERIRITFNGQMTPSIPPQITATSIQRIGGAAPQPPSQTQIRGTITQVGQGFLTVRSTQGQLFNVIFAQARHFCVRQQVIVTYNTITFDNPPRITATDITPIC